MTATLSIVGCGRLGRSLARLWHESDTFEIGSIANRSLASAQGAVDFAGAGLAAATLGEVNRADLVLIAAPDSSIGDCCDALASSGKIAPETIVFHCSGALGSDVLRAASRMGASVASIHPVKSFADPALAVRSFAGTWCGTEGDERALAALCPAFERIDARLFSVDASEKTTYHAGAVMACNYLVTLIDAGLRCYERAGVPREQARSILGPLLSGTLDNVAQRGIDAALTGPIARGESAVVAAQLEALEGFDADLATLYRTLGQATLAIARRTGDVSESDLEALETLLGR